MGEKRKIKILFTIPNFETAGSGRVLYDLAGNLDKTEFDVEIACRHNRGKFFPIVESLGFPIHFCSTTTSYTPWLGLPFRIVRIAGFFRKRKFDLIHSWHWSSDWTEPLAARLAGVKWMYTKKAMSWGSPKSWRLRSKLATFITTINPDMKARYFPSLNNVRLIPLGLDVEHFDLQKKTYQVGALSFTQNSFVLVSVVNLIKAKGLEVLVEACSRLKDPTVKTLIVGDFSSEYGQGIFAMVQQMGLADSIFFTGKVLDVRPYLASSDVFVTPTNVDWEGMPMAPVESMASGRIVIGTNTSGTNYILKGFEQFLVPPNDPKALTEKILEVRKMSQEQRASVASRLREKVVREFSTRQFALNYGNLYKEILLKKA